MTIIRESIYPKFQDHPVISTDSRKIPPGCLFFALKGENFNGNLFARQALDQGAAFAIIDEPQATTDPRLAVDPQLADVPRLTDDPGLTDVPRLTDDPRYILVPDVLETLQQLALHHRRQFTIPVIAITGTNGKTTTKELINTVLSRKYKTTSTQGNLNNHIGVPLTLLAMNRATEIAIIEMGANHPGEIDLLCRIAEPGFGIITNIGKAHLEGFGGYEGVIRTKTELYRYLQSNQGKIFVNKDNPLLMEHACKGIAATYGAPPADTALGAMSASPCVEMEVLPLNLPPYPIRSKLYGGYNATNILAAAAIGQYFGVSSAEIAAAIGSYESSNNRSQVLQTASNLLIMDAYNANPSSMEAAIETFAAADYKNKVVILGDMLELGEDTDSEHLALMERVATHKFAEVYLVGPTLTRLNTRRENTCFNDSELAAIWFSHHKLQDNTVLIKGSRGIRLESIAPLL